VKALILKYSLILLLGLLFEWWLVCYSPFHFPDRITPLSFPGDSSPSPTISVNGLLLVGLLLTVLILALKSYLKTNPETNILKMTTLGAMICLSSEIIFQAIRQPFIDAQTFNEHLYYFLLGTIGTSIFGAVFSFLIAFQLKKKKTAQLVTLIIGFLIIANLVKYFFPTLEQ